MGRRIRNNEFRFAVGAPDKSNSSSWKLLIIKNDVYLLERSMGKIQKFSFHQSGICRWASIKQRTDGQDRATIKWRRDTIPPAGSGKASLLVSLAFPTNHLSSAFPDFNPDIYWISPAPLGMALGIDVFLTHEPCTSVAQVFSKSGDRKIVFAIQLEDDTTLYLAYYIFECGPVEIKAPGKPRVPGQVFGELHFPNVDNHDTGRPIRMLMIPHKHCPPTVWELGGYEVGPWGPMNNHSPKGVSAQRDPPPAPAGNRLTDSTR